jgi:glycerol-3-phosphate dehydrogenase
MNRDEGVRALEQRREQWDILIIGGGATGLGAAVDAASRGYRTVLLEQHDFAKGTSSRSTKLIHGGVRYLRQGNIGLVRDSLRERALLLHNAPHVARTQSFVVPAYGAFERAWYGVGLKLYDRLAGRFSLGPSRFLSREETTRELPSARGDGLRGGVQYFDGQFDDARLAISLAQTATGLGAVALNYIKVVRLLKQGGRTAGAVAVDSETGREHEVRARVVINATGVFTDAVRRLDDLNATPLVTVSQGAHVVVARKFLPGASALMVPKTRDGRVLFAIPWLSHVVIGTTDVPVTETPLEPRPFREEIKFLLEESGRYLAGAPRQQDVLSTFAGLRPLVKGTAAHTAQLSRDHTILVSPSGLVSIAGGKWTTYRKMGEDVIDRAADLIGPAARPSATHNLRLHGADSDSKTSMALTRGFVRHIAREEMARTVEDVLARRWRTLFIDARAAIGAAPMVAEVLGSELNRPAEWRDEQVAAFRKMASGYLPGGR